MNDLLLCISEMARDSAVGRERVLIVPGSLQLENAANQHTGGPQNDINQQILDVSSHRNAALFLSFDADSLRGE